MSHELGPAGPELVEQPLEDQKRQVLGSGKFKAYKPGKIDLEDIAGEQRDPRWGLVGDERSMKEIEATRQQAAGGTMPPMGGEGGRGGGRALPGERGSPTEPGELPPAGPRRAFTFDSIPAAKAWAEQQGLRLDMADVADVAPVNEALKAIDDVIRRYPFMRSGKVPFQGFATFASHLCPAAVREEGQRQKYWAVTERVAGKTFIFFNQENAFKSGKGPVGEVTRGTLAPSNRTVYGATIHELGHAIPMALAMSDQKLSQHVDKALDEAQLTDQFIGVTLKSRYAIAFRSSEMWPEIFGLFNTPGGMAHLTPYQRRQWQKFATILNKRLAQRGHAVLPVGQALRAIQEGKF